MIPIRDDNPVHKTPYVTILLLVVNISLFLYQMFIVGGSEGEAFWMKFGAIPFEITHFRELSTTPAYDTPFPNIFTLFTSMFLHGGFMHLGGNMLYLWIFGDNIEYIMGSFRFLGFYLLTGIIAALSHIIIDPSSTTPMIGASGAISGILGAYLLKFPKARVQVLIFLFVFITTINVPAIIVLGFWFIMQLMSGYAALGQSTGGGVAWFAHIGGFIAGLILVNRFQKRRTTLYY